MIELITSISFLASAASMHMGAAGLSFGNLSASTSSDVASSTADASALVIEATSTKASYASEVKQYYKDQPILIEIARCESEFRQFDKKGQVIRGIANPKDVGIMQINEKYHLAKAESLGYNIYSVEGNLAYAKLIYKDQGAQPWSASSPCWSKPLAVK